MTVRSLPDGKRGKVLAWAIATLVASLTWAFVLSPLQYYYDSLVDRRDSLGLRLAREMGFLAAHRTLLAREKPIHPLPADQLISGSTDAVAAASLQERVQAAALAVHANVRSIEPLSSEQVGEYRRIAVRFELTGAFQTLIKMFEKIEEGSKGILVNDTRIKSDTPGIEDPNRPLECAFTAYAFRTASSLKQTK